MNNEPKNILSKLEKVPTQVPNDLFFETLKKNVVAKLEKEPEIVPFYRKSWIQAAASILILIGIGSVYLFNSKTPVTEPKSKIEFSSFRNKDSIKDKEDNHADLDEIDLALVQTEHADIQTPSQPQPNKKKISPSSELEQMWNELNDEEILEYLQEESDDIDEDLIVGL